MSASKKKKTQGVVAEEEPAEAPAEEIQDGAEAERPAAAPDEGVEQWKDRALRAQADMANMRKRIDQEVEDRTRMRMEALFSELITLHDHLELALESVPESLDADDAGRSFADGVRAIHVSLDMLMQRYGLEPIHPQEHHEFDPELHEAVHTEDRHDLEQPQLDLLRRGYRMGRRILRPAQVRLLQPPAEPGAGAPKKEKDEDEA